jgi:hypothetical protein
MIRNIAVTPRREVARAIPAGKANVGAVIVSRCPPASDEMKARMLLGVTAVESHAAIALVEAAAEQRLRHAATSRVNGTDVADASP